MTEQPDGDEENGAKRGSQEPEVRSQEKAEGNSKLQIQDSRANAEIPSISSGQALRVAQDDGPAGLKPAATSWHGHPGRVL